ncbi:molybdopterin synthase sulfur carrier subunit [Helicobacter anseris]|uniref:Molybdopterin synthase sulfur carrier subunit n=1 Tax=Helicobacter anseris TaxID=375926 RepID=A0A3D8JBQ1_9HELI|nr:MoaD/ThiS family protein [Helicobacter anseris]RDU74274.1 molybdopterin synthase sulfur carrier subunit [Helicobacter anseris]
MIHVEFLGPIGIDSRTYEAKNLKELKEQLHQISELKEWLKISAVAINDEIVDSVDVELKEGDKVVILPPVCGG